MEITISWNANHRAYGVGMCVAGLPASYVYTPNATQLINFMLIVKQMHPITLAWHQSMTQQGRQALIELFIVHGLVKR